MDLIKENEKLKNKIEKLELQMKTNLERYTQTIVLYESDLKEKNKNFESKIKECVFWSNEKVKFEEQNEKLKDFVLNLALERGIK